MVYDLHVKLGILFALLFLWRIDAECAEYLYFQHCFFDFRKMNVGQLDLKLQCYVCLRITIPFPSPIVTQLWSRTLNPLVAKCETHGLLRPSISANALIGLPCSRAVFLKWYWFILLDRPLAGRYSSIARRENLWPFYIPPSQRS